MIDPISGAAISAGGKVATTAALTVVKKLTFEVRVARSAAGAAKARGVKVSIGLLQAALKKPEVKTDCKSAGSASDVTRTVLDAIECEGLEGRSGDFLLSLLRTATAQQMSAGDAQAQMYEQVIAPIAAIAENGKISIESVLPRFPRALAKDALGLEPAVGENALARMLLALAEQSQRAETLQDWLHSRPSWLAESEAVDGWLGLLSIVCGTSKGGRAWIERALKGGATPRAYWIAQIVGINRSESEALDLLSDCRGHPLIESILTENELAVREEQLQQWSPRTAMQRGFAASIRAQQLFEARRLDEAIEFSVSEFEQEEFGGVGEIGVRALMTRALVGELHQQSEDFSAARDLAIEIRDYRRRTGSPDSEALVLAIEASLMLHDHARAESLFTAAPEGEATLAEVDDPKVRNAAALAFLQMGRLSDARTLVGETTSTSIRLQLAAREAEANEEHVEASRLLSEAIEATDDWNEKAALCSFLAFHGVVHSFVEIMRPLNAQRCDEIDSIAALFREQPGAESRMLSAALDNPRLARALGQFYSDRDRDEDAVRLAEQSAHRWGDADEWLRAAGIHLHSGEYDAAVDRAQSALVAGGDKWGARARALRLQLHARYQQRKWEEVAPLARAILRYEPDAADAAWSLIFAYHHAADDGQAFREWRSRTVCRVPQDAQQASLWLHLFQRFGTEMAQVSEVVSMCRRFASDEQVRRLAVGALLFAPIEDQDVDVQLLEFVNEYHSDFPERPRLIWAVPIDGDDPKELLAAIDRAAGGPRPTSEVDEHLRNGTLPIGLIGHFVRRGFAELLITNRHTARFAGRSDEQPFEVSVIEKAKLQGAALDTTAALTLALLDADSADVLRRFPRRLFGTYQQLRDANEARESFERSGDYIVPSSVDEGPSVVIIPETETVARQQLADQLIALLRQTERSEPPGLSLPNERYESFLGSWSQSLLRAAEADIPLWCDDAATRQIAGVFGIQSFGTPELVEYMRSAGLLTEQQADAFDAVLIRAHLVGIRYREKSWDLAASFDRAPAGIAQAILQGGPSSAADKIEIVVRGIEKCVDEPQAMKDWAYVGAKYVLSIAGTEENGVTNLARFIRASLMMSWSVAHVLPFVLQGVRAAGENLWDAALVEAVTEYWRAILSVLPADLAAPKLLGMVKLLPEADRRLDLDIVLREGQ